MPRTAERLDRSEDHIGIGSLLVPTEESEVRRRAYATKCIARLPKYVVDVRHEQDTPDGRARCVECGKKRLAKPCRKYHETRAISLATRRLEGFECLGLNICFWRRQNRNFRQNLGAIDLQTTIRNANEIRGRRAYPVGHGGRGHTTIFPI